MAILEVAVTVLMAVFITAILGWVALAIVGSAVIRDELVWDAADVQVRIITVGSSPQVVRRTANKAAEHFDDIHIVSEVDMPPAPNTTVHVVPDDFDSEAEHKGRALDWASKNIECDREYILYLDEDSILPEFSGLPDDDIVQLRERPQRSYKWTPFFVDTYRLGWQYEMNGFTQISYPLYLWGGGVAVRQSCEDEVGWDQYAIAEDTHFLWRAISQGFTYNISPDSIRNQAPPTVRQLLKQRRRWASATFAASSHLPLHWRTAVIIRTLLWAMSIIILPLMIILGAGVVTLHPLLVITLLAPILWALIGSAPADKSVRTAIVSLVLFPIWHTINAAGALWGLLSPVDDFEVVEKK